MTELTRHRGILWDAPVKRVPTEFVASLLHEGGFCLALDHEEAAHLLKVSADQLARLAAEGRLHGETYRPSREGEEEVPVLVIPAGLTPAAFRARLDQEPPENDDA